VRKTRAAAGKKKKKRARAKGRNAQERKQRTIVWSSFDAQKTIPLDSTPAILRGLRLAATSTFR
jgi:hypothetical protein